MFGLILQPIGRCGELTALHALVKQSGDECRYERQLLVVVVWDLLAALTNGESLTYVFRRGVAETGWRHLFLPPTLRKHDPIDRLYRRLNPAYSKSSDPHVPGRLDAQPSREKGTERR